MKCSPQYEVPSAFICPLFNTQILKPQATLSPPYHTSNAYDYKIVLGSDPRFLCAKAALSASVRKGDREEHLAYFVRV